MRGICFFINRKKMSSKRKTYTYGRKLSGKRKNDSEPWDVEVDHNAPKKMPKKNNIWAKVSSSPFKSSPVKKNDIVLNDPFGFDDSDPYSFDDNEKLTKKKTPVKVKTTKIASGKKTTPVKSKAKLSSAPLSPNSKLSGRPMPKESVTINLKDLTTVGSPKKKGRATAQKSTKTVKKDIFRDKEELRKGNTTHRKNTKNSKGLIKEETEDQNKEQDVCDEIPIQFVDDVDIKMIVLQKTPKKKKGRKVKKPAVIKASTKPNANNDSKVVNNDCSDNLTRLQQDIVNSDSLEDEKASQDTQEDTSIEPGSEVVDELNNSKGEENSPEIAECSMDVGEMEEDSDEPLKNGKNVEESHTKIKPQSLFTYYDKQDKLKKDAKDGSIYRESKRIRLISEGSENSLGEDVAYVRKPATGAGQLTKHNDKDQPSLENEQESQSSSQSVDLEKKVKVHADFFI